MGVPSCAVACLVILVVVMWRTGVWGGERPGGGYAAHAARRSLFPAELRSFAPVSPAHAREAEDAVADFQGVFRGTFGPKVDGPRVVRALFAARARAAKALGELKMRMPNDMPAEQRFEQAREELDARLMEHIEDARQRCGAALLHPGPVGDAWYGAWYHAANDSGGDVREAGWPLK